MSNHAPVPPPLCRWWIRGAGWLAPSCVRRAWLAEWNAGLDSLWTLIERGEFALDWPVRLAAFCREALANAFWLRFARVDVLRWVRGPVFLLSCCATMLVVSAILTHGFAVTRFLVHTARAWRQFPGHAGMGDPRLNRVILYSLPIATALAAGAALAAIGRRSMHRQGGRSWWFFAVKTASMTVTASLWWIEGGAILRAHLRHHELLRQMAGGLGLALLFILVFGWAVAWSIADQRWRCPVCLRRLAMPVTFGSWGSVFEPPATEALCSEGHGSLCMAEVITGADDQWTALDNSWRGFFLHR